ncbi:biliverdin-producing heme oxygenase [Jiella pacifica]|uniref:Heme oxygenase n=1 Tax=Jiella pacifica TaxID=2696469 RepID=A0A6N9T7G4_9HYPH|nr:biliverdin-producing heme oxygenase [Jiella pacifica]NDW06155.1 hypothetical protein [Jiella pacifica]
MNEFAAFTTIGTKTIPTGTEPGGLRRFLRAHTVDAHARLDTRFGDFAGSQVLQSYRRFIGMNLLAYHGLAAFFDIVDAGETVPDAAEATLRQKIELSLQHLEDDRASMDLDCPPAHGFSLAPCETSEMAGLAYVLDGSRLGARFIYRRLEQSGLVDSQDGEVSTAYLRSAFGGDRQGAETFGLSLAEDAVIKERALKAALATFALFERCLDQVAAHEGGKEPPR